MTSRAQRVAWLVAGLSVALAAAGLAQWAKGSGDLGDSRWTLTLTLAYAPAGAALVSRAPRLGWVFLAIAFTASLALLAGEHAGAVAEGRAAAGGHLAVWVSSWSWVPAYVLLLGVVPSLLPDGKPLAGRWGWSYRLGLLATAVGVVGWAIVPYDELDEASDAALALGADNPVGIPGTAPVIALGLLLLVAAAAWGLAGLVVRWRRSGGAAKQHLRWVLAGVVATAVMYGLAQAAPAGASALLTLAMLPLPVSIAVAVLGHGMWDPELVVRRSLVWLLLSAVVAALFVAVVAVLGNVVGDRVGAPVVAAALAALLVAPLRERLQRTVSRLLHGGGADPYAVVTALGDRLAAVTSPQDALAEAAAGVAAALRLPAVRVSVVDGPLVSHGDPAQLEPGAHRVELVHAGEVVGLLEAAPRRPGKNLRASDRRLLESLARQAGAAAHAARLDAELQRSRTRVVTAREEERRRLRRDLHDSLGPALAGVALQLETLPVHGSPEALQATAARLAGRVQDAVADVRRLVEGLGSASDLGLVEGLRAQVEAFDAPALRSRLTVDESRLRGLPAAVEEVAVRVVGEALANTARHARADSCDVLADLWDDELVVVVRDNGVGVSAARARGGTAGTGLGVASMAQAAAEIGGRCTVRDAPGGGTEVRLVVPVPR